MIDEKDTFKDLMDIVASMSDVRLIESYENMERLIDNDDVGKSLFIDAVVTLYEFMRDECVRRVARSCGHLVDDTNQETEKHKQQNCAKG